MVGFSTNRLYGSLSQVLNNLHPRLFKGSDWQIFELAGFTSHSPCFLFYLRTINCRDHNDSIIGLVTIGLVDNNTIVLSPSSRA